MDIKNIPTKRVLIFKYLVCRLLINLKEESVFQDFDYKTYINNKVRDRVGEKYFINNYKTKKLSKILDEINIPTDDRVEFSNSIYDYIINKEFTMINNEMQSSNGIIDTLILKSNFEDSLSALYQEYGPCEIYIMQEKAYLTIYELSFFEDIYKTDVVIDGESGNKYYAVIAHRRK